MRHCSVFSFFEKLGAVAIVSLLTAAAGSAQEPVQGPKMSQASLLGDSLHELEARVNELNKTLLEMHAEVARSRTEAAELRQELRETREQVASLKRELGEGLRRPAGPAALAGGSAAEPGIAARPSELPTDERLAKLEEDQQLLSAKIEDQYQTKVESGSKHRVRLSGIALLNVFSTRGAVDNLDLPNWARARGPLDSSGSFGATVRQSLLGLEVFGPEVDGAKTSADAQFDFFGGFPNSPDGVTAGLVRLRVARLRLDWPRTSIVAGQDAPFFSPLSPTSLASLAYPAFSYSGNLWTWTPQIRVERRVDLTDNSSILLQGGILDPLTGEPPTGSFYRSPEAGERGGQPAYATRVAWTHSVLGRPMTLGAGGYYARQDWGFDRTVDAWAGTTDWNLPLGRWVSFTGEFYRGRALGGLGGGLSRSVLFSGPLADRATSVLGLNTTGGWAQLKLRPSEKLEFNGAFGEDDPSASDLRRFPQSQSFIRASFARNQTVLFNSIYHLRSNLLLSAEYRRIRTSEISAVSYTANHLNLSAGVLF